MDGGTKCPCVYILASKRNGTLYVGVTSDPVRRIWQHRNGETGGFTSRYGVKLLVYLELHASMADAIVREKQIKHWRRGWKLALIERDNPTWRDRYGEIVGQLDESEDRHAREGGHPGGRPEIGGQPPGLPLSRE